MNYILPLILILSSIGIFFGYVDPNYKGSGNLVDNNLSTYGIQQLKDELTKYDATIINSNNVVQNRKLLTDKNNKITEIEKANLTKAVPDNIDNVKLVLELSNIAATRNLSLKNISIGDGSSSSGSIGPDNTPYGTLALKFSVNTTYDNFLNLLKDLEQNMRIIDITDVSFTSTDTGFYDFNISLNTYWLK
jgi:Tfp pilus assembly protein PilO